MCMKDTRGIKNIAVNISMSLGLNILRRKSDKACHFRFYEYFILIKILPFTRPVTKNNERKRFSVDCTGGHFDSLTGLLKNMVACLACAYLVNDKYKRDDATVELHVYMYFSEINIFSLFFFFFLKWWFNELQLILVCNNWLVRHDCKNPRWGAVSCLVL